MGQLRNIDQSKTKTQPQGIQCCYENASPVILLQFVEVSDGRGRERLTVACFFHISEICICGQMEAEWSMSQGCGWGRVLWSAMATFVPVDESEHGAVACGTAEKDGLWCCCTGGAWRWPTVLYSAASVAAPTFNNPIKCEGFAHVTLVAVPCLHVPIHTEIWPHCTS